eukprot:364420-Chlamydomonas_euryale.AAC.2
MDGEGGEGQNREGSILWSMYSCNMMMVASPFNRAAWTASACCCGRAGSPIALHLPRCIRPTRGVRVCSYPELPRCPSLSSPHAHRGLRDAVNLDHHAHWVWERRAAKVLLHKRRRHQRRAVFCHEAGAAVGRPPATVLGHHVYEKDVDGRLGAAAHYADDLQVRVQTRRQ